MNIRYRVELNEAERTQLAALLNGGKHPARKLKRAQILMAADACSATALMAGRVASSKNAPETPGVVAAKCSLVS